MIAARDLDAILILDESSARPNPGVWWWMLERMQAARYRRASPSFIERADLRRAGGGVVAQGTRRCRRRLLTAGCSLQFQERFYLRYLVSGIDSLPELLLVFL